MSSVEHNIKKNIEEAAWMAELSVSIPALTINWTKSESPDWISDSGIGIEITNLTSANSREIFDYKNPIKHTLREVAGIDYKTDGLGVYETESGEQFRYYYRSKVLELESGQSISVDELDEGGHQKYDDSRCILCTGESVDIGAHVYDYINIAREGLKKKIELLNTDNYNKLKSNRLEIVFLEFSRVEQDKVEDLMDEIIEIQKKYETKFDVVYLRLLEDIIVFDLNGGTVDRYCIQKLKNKPNGERIRECLSDGMCYSLSDVVDFRGKR